VATWGDDMVGGAGNCNNVDLLRCSSQELSTCPAGYHFDSPEPGKTRCWALPACPAPGVYDSSKERCIAPTSSTPYCSDISCGQASDHEGVEEILGEDATIPMTEDGCLGTVKVFGGKDSRCRKTETFSCIGTFGNGCCDKERVCGGLVRCNDDEIKTFTAYKKGLCHYVGEYCSRRIRFINVCIQKKKTYCCFQSKLGRIIQQQGRMQLGWGWGSPESPDCRGFTLEDLQLIDFSTINMSEFYQDIYRDVNNTIGVQIGEKFKDYLGNFSVPSMP